MKTYKLYLDGEYYGLVHGYNKADALRGFDRSAYDTIRLIEV